MTNARLARRTLLGALALPALASAQGNAQGNGSDWPNQSVRFIGIFPPGGGTDILSRIWCMKMAEITGQQFVVENRSGSAGNIGTEAIARARPDGYTIGLASVAALAIAPTLYSRIPFDPEKDFSYLGGLWQLPNLLVINNDVPARTVPELIALIRANPGKYSFASSGSGTTVHLSGEMFKSLAQLDMVHVPYRGGAPAHIDLLAGRVQMIFDNIPQGLQSAREGKVRALAVTSAQRSPLAPEYPAMAEFLPGFDIDSWGGVMAPAGLPPAMVERMARITRQALETDEVKRKYAENGATTWHLGPQQLASFRRQNEAAFAPIIRASGARVD